MTDAALVGDDLTLDDPPHAGPGEQVTDTARETLDPILHGVLELVAAAGEELDAVVLKGVVGRGDHDAQVDAHPGRRVGDGRGGRDADPEDIRRRHLVRFLTLKPIAFEEPGSYFQRYATIRDGIAVTAAEVREGVNLVNLRESIAPTRERATLALREDARHRMRRVLLRKA